MPKRIRRGGTMQCDIYALRFLNTKKTPSQEGLFFCGSDFEGFEYLRVASKRLAMGRSVAQTEQGWKWRFRVAPGHSDHCRTTVMRSVGSGNSVFDKSILKISTSRTCFCKKNTCSDALFRCFLKEPFESLRPHPVAPS